ncbi:hypothetical protein Tco_0137481, partial [Tanacetum coccineum]
QRDTPPFPVHGTKILEIYLPLRKRPCRTAPTPRYEAGESLAAGAARQDGSAVARSDLYGFVDMVDAALGCLMSSELGYGGWHHVFPVEDAREDLSLMGGRVNMLFRDRPYHRRIALLMEEEARVSCVTWAQSMDASDKAPSEGIGSQETGSDYRDADSGPSEIETAYRGTKTAKEVTGPDDRVSEAAGTC